MKDCLVSRYNISNFFYHANTFNINDFKTLYRRCGLRLCLSNHKKISSTYILEKLFLYIEDCCMVGDLTGS